MILVTGGTGFIGKELIQHLIASGKQVRILLRPAKKSPQLPKGIAVDAAVCSLRDERGLRAAMRGVDTIFHLAGTERYSSRSQLNDVDVLGTQGLVNAAAHAGIKKIVMVSHLGADRLSAYPVLRAKGIAENTITASGLPYTIVRTAVVFGRGDQFTTSFARLLRLSPGILFIPGEGESLLQPVWIEDLVNCLAMSMEREDLVNQTISIGGIEMLTFRQIITQIMRVTGLERRIHSLPPPLMRRLAVGVDHFSPFPLSIYWLDYLSVDRTTLLDTIPRVFGILPARFHQQLDYLTSPAIYKTQKKGFVTK
ncbi:MAG: NAD(P)H-binding protein [Chloroflexota bacterium]|jgi:NADH dehydrogenase